MFTQIGNELYNKLNTSKSTLGIAEVLNYHPTTTFQQFPVLIVLPTDTEAEVLDTCKFVADTKYTTRIYVQNGTSPAEREASLRSVVDGVISLIVADFKPGGSYLNGKAESCKVQVKRGYTEDQQALRVADIIFSFMIHF